MGTVVDIIFAENHNPPDLPIAVLVKFDNYCGPSFSNMPFCVPMHYSSHCNCICK